MAPAVVQLISSIWGPLSTQAAAKVLSDTNNDFTVIGVCSTEQHVSRRLAALLAGGATTLGHQLPGLQLQVAPRERVLLLDATAMLGPSLLAALVTSHTRTQPAVGSAAAAAVRAAARRAGSGPGTIPVEGVAQLLVLQLLVFLFAVCNVVVISSDSFDPDLLQLLEAAGNIATSVPALTAPAATTGSSSCSSAATAAAAAAPAASSDREGKGQRSTRGAQQQQQRQQRRSSRTETPGTEPGRHHQQQQRQQQQQQQQRAVAVPPALAAGNLTTPAAHVADLVLLQCCTGQQQLTPEALCQLQALASSCLDSTAWAHRPQQLSQVTRYSCQQLQKQPPAGKADGGGGSSSDDSSSRGRDTSRSGPGGSIGVNVWPVPTATGDAKVAAGAGGGNSSWMTPPQLQQLANMLLRQPRHAAGSSSSSSSSSSVHHTDAGSARDGGSAAGGSSSSFSMVAHGGAFSRVITEGEWLRGADRVWDAVQDSPELLAYYKACAGARLAGAGGWGSAASALQQLGGHGSS